MAATNCVKFASILLPKLLKLFAMSHKSTWLPFICTLLQILSQFNDSISSICPELSHLHLIHYTPHGANKDRQLEHKRLVLQKNHKYWKSHTCAYTKHQLCRGPCLYLVWVHNFQCVWDFFYTKRLWQKYTYSSIY